MKRTYPERGLYELEEKMACLHVLTDGVASMNRAIEVIDQIFDNNTPREKVILLSTVHRAKGLEADTVIILEPELIPHPLAQDDPAQLQQEMNLKFVAETRHKQKLVYAYGNNDRDDERDEAEGRISEEKETVQ